MIVIRDLYPQAPAHFLVIPKRHLTGLDEAFPETGNREVTLIGQLLERGTLVAREHGLLPNGFRSVLNTGRGAGQSVFHLHLHIIGGADLNGGFA